MLTVKPWMLLVSLLLNAAFLGFAAAHGLRAYTEPGPRFAMPPMMERMGEDPRVVRDRVFIAEGMVLDRAFGEERPQIEAARQAMDDAKRKIETLLRAETLDAPAFDSAMTEMQAVSARGFAALDRSLRKFAQLDAKERRAIADALAHMGPPGPRGLRIPLGDVPPPPPPP